MYSALYPFELRNVPLVASAAGCHGAFFDQPLCFLQVVQGYLIVGHVYPEREPVHVCSLCLEGFEPPQHFIGFFVFSEPFVCIGKVYPGYEGVSVFLLLFTQLEGEVAPVYRLDVELRKHAGEHYLVAGFYGGRCIVCPAEISVGLFCIHYGLRILHLLSEAYAPEIFRAGIRHLLAVCSRDLKETLYYLFGLFDVLYQILPDSFSYFFYMAFILRQ